MRNGVIFLLLFGLAAPVAAQIGVPPLGGTLGPAVGRIGNTLGDIVDHATDIDAVEPVRSAARLAQDRLARLTDFVQARRDAVEMDDSGQPARRGVVLLLDPDPATLASAKALGFDNGGIERLDSLGIAAAELRVPQGMSLRQALEQLRKALPDATVTADQLHFPGGATASGAARTKAPMSKSHPAIGATVGVIDGGVASAVPVSRQQGLAKGAPTASDHGTAVASLLRYAGVTHIVVADVYGRDPAGGDALAIARAMNWMAAQKVPVISISLVGPRNPLIERAVSALSARGVTVVAAVGNDGPAAPPAYPASYPTVIAVSAVDGRNRALIEAGRALHLDYTAPGADIAAADGKGRMRAVRGTSFAVPLVAARIAAQLDRGKNGRALQAALDAEARDLGRKGPDFRYGRGLLCDDCRPR
tara:strand:- start:165 stop:1421 length:1257 start_codon:yes stop_codon:yes gene_type:complete